MNDLSDLHNWPAVERRSRRHARLAAVVLAVLVISSCLAFSAYREGYDMAFVSAMLGLALVVSGVALAVSAPAGVSTSVRRSAPASRSISVSRSTSARRSTLLTEGCLSLRLAQELFARAQQPSVRCVQRQAAHLGSDLTRSRRNSPPHEHQPKLPPVPRSSRLALGSTARSRSIRRIVRVV